MRPIACFIAAIVLLSSVATANAAEIRRETDLNGGLAVISISGPLGGDDVERFRDALIGVERGVIVLDSPGGELGVGLSIGMTARMRQLGTFVPAGGQCLSACALLWLGGAVRSLHEDGAVGFHAAHTEVDGVATETGRGNAAVGAYLTNLGYSLDLVLEVTKASPHEITVLTPQLADWIGLQVEWLAREGGEAAPKTARTAPSSDVAAVMAGEAVAFVGAYLFWLAEDGPVPPAVVEEVYASQVAYFGEWIGRDEMIRRQRDYARRWPIHRIEATARPRASCDPVLGMCVVEGWARFHARSETRNRVSDGTLAYRYVLERRHGRFRIVGETSEVLERNHRPIRLAEARLTRRIQAELNRLGCDPGPVDGIWGPQTAAAFARFHRANGTDRWSETPTPRDLSMMRSKRGVLCR